MVSGVSGGVGAADLATLGGAALAIVVVTALLTAVIQYGLRKAKVERHINEIYEAIQTKAAAAAAADYSGLPQPLFELLTTLREELGPLLDLGGPMASMAEQIGKALNRATSFTSPKHPTPAQGATILVQPNPPAYLTETKDHPSANSELQKAAREFNRFWENKSCIKNLIWETLNKLGGRDLF